MRHTCASAAEARALLDSVRADTPDYVRLSAEGTELRVRLTARSAASARATLEDLFACLRAAERTLSAGRPDAAE